MAGEAPDFIDVGRHRDLGDRRWEAWLPNVLLVLIAVLPVLALFNVFGQKPTVAKAANPGGVATLELNAPKDLRGGLLFQARFDIKAGREIKDAVLVLDSGWLESMTLNSVEPSPSQETSRNGSIALDLGNIPAGKLWREYLQFQVNPVNVGKQSQDVTLYDGNVELLHLNRDVMVWP
jgi:hypothetical protein